jgi:GNAT superfamily N-acetyltransferase
MVQLPQFRVFFDPECPLPYRNFAIPDRGADPSPEQVFAVFEHFDRRGRVPHFEFFPKDAPLVDVALHAAGCVVDARPTVMSCDPARRRRTPRPNEITVSTITKEAEVLESVVLARSVFGAEPPQPSDVARRSQELEYGSQVLLARSPAGQPIGTAQLMPAVDGVSEIVAVGVHRAFRRRGIALWLVHELLGHAAEEQWGLTWLATTPALRRLYASAGFSAVGTALDAHLDPDPGGIPAGEQGLRSSSLRSEHSLDADVDNYPDGGPE